MTTSSKAAYEALRRIRELEDRVRELEAEIRAVLEELVS